MARKKKCCNTQWQGPALGLVAFACLYTFNSRPALQSVDKVKINEAEWMRMQTAAKRQLSRQPGHALRRPQGTVASLGEQVALQKKGMAPGIGDKSASPRSAISQSQKWSATQIVKYMDGHPSRAYFAHLFSHGGFRKGIEVGVADGRFTEHMLIVGRPALWMMCEPFPNDALISRYPAAGGELTAEQQAYRNDRVGKKQEIASATWHERGIDNGIVLKLLKYFSTDAKVINSIPKGSIDFVYLDGAHDYKNVKLELEPYWQMLSVGGVLAGHDYQNHGEKPLECRGCDNIPRARHYTQYGLDHGKKTGAFAANMNKVVKAVQEWLTESHPQSHLHHTMENFTRESLAADGLDFDLVITNTYNPSWYIIKETS